MMRSAEDCAKLILINMAAYNKEKEKDINKFLISKSTIRVLSDRKNIRNIFIEQLKKELLHLGWIFVDFQDKQDKYAVFNIDDIDNLKKLTSKYAKSAIEDMDDSEEVDDIYSEFFDEGINEEDSDDEDWEE